MFNINKKKSTEPFIYKVTLECLGRSLEFGLSVEEVNSIKELPQLLKDRFSQIQKKRKTAKTAKTPKATSSLRVAEVTPEAM